MSVSEIVVRELPEQLTVVVRKRISVQETNRIPEWIQLTLAAVQRVGQEPRGMPFVRYLTMAADGMEVEVGWPVSERLSGDGLVSVSTLPGGPAAVASYFGPYDEIGPAYEAMQAWCREHGRPIAGPPWESYFTDPRVETDQTKWRTDIHFPLGV